MDTLPIELAGPGASSTCSTVFFVNPSYFLLSLIQFTLLVLSSDSHSFVNFSILAGLVAYMTSCLAGQFIQVIDDIITLFAQRKDSYNLRPVDGVHFIEYFIKNWYSALCFRAQKKSGHSAH